VRYVEVGGARVSVIGLGTWQFGSGEWGYGREYADRTAGELVRRALDLGINLIDTAEAYGMGASERIVGAAVGERRAEAFLATKLLPLAPLEQVVEWRGGLSAARLGVETIDLYQVHWPNPLVPLGWTMAGVRRLRDAGVIEHAGVSNFSADQWWAAERAYGAPVLSNQVQYSLAQRRIEADLLPYAQARGRLVIAYSPLAQGLLGARYDGGHPPSGSARLANPLFLPDNLERATPLLDVLRDVAAGHDVTPAQVALAWLIRRPNVVVIPGASSVAQLEANAAAAEVVLTDGEDAALTAASDAFHPRTGVQAVPDLVRARVGAVRR
jgi:aryl-alcohol dehydrogenase-like predicted oxidoreductase